MEVLCSRRQNAYIRKELFFKSKNNLVFPFQDHKSTISISIAKKERMRQSGPLSQAYITLLWRGLASFCQLIKINHGSFDGIYIKPLPCLPGCQTLVGCLLFDQASPRLLCWIFSLISDSWWYFWSLHEHLAMDDLVQALVLPHLSGDGQRCFL